MDHRLDGLKRAIAAAESRIDRGREEDCGDCALPPSCRGCLHRAIGHSLVVIAEGITPRMSMARTAILSSLPDRPKDLPLAGPEDLAAALAFALGVDVRRRNRDAADIMARIIARRLVEHLAQSGFVVMKRTPVLQGERRQGQ